MSLNAMARPAARDPGPLVTLVRCRTVAKVDSIGLVVRRWTQCADPDHDQQAQLVLLQPDAHVVRSGRGALPVFPPVGFPGPPPEPDVRLVGASGSPQVAAGRWCCPHVALGQREGIFVPR
jgi:hypothetical protein